LLESDGSKNLFLVFEGIDGAGKTTTAIALATAVNGMYIKSPPEPFTNIKQRILESAAPLARFTYFLSSNIQLSELAKVYLQRNHVISDRYVWSTIAYHAAMENIQPSELYNLAKPLIHNLLMPHYVIYLTVKRETQLQRLKIKADNALQKRLLMSENFQARLKQAYECVRSLFCVDWIEIDTSDKSPLEIVQIIRNTIPI
jgi:dTMP kinase